MICGPLDKHLGRHGSCMRTSKLAESLIGQPMFKIIDEARKLEQRGIDVVHLEIGDPDFDTPEFIRESGARAILEGDTHYVSSWGMPELRQAVQDVTELSRDFRPELNQVLITPGANISIYYAIATTTDPGEEVLYPSPGFPTYQSTVLATGTVGVPYPLKSEQGFSIKAENIEPLITPRTRLLILNSPQNPTGAVTSEKDLREVFELAEKYNLWIYSDEIYARMNYGEVPHFSLSTIDACRKRVILSNGFSKAFAMTGWRLGTIIAPEEIASKMMLLLQTTSSCVSPFIQRAGLSALRGDQSVINDMMRVYRERRDFVVDQLNSIPGIECHTPGGAFYVFPSIKSFKLSSEEFCDRLLLDGFVAAVPGSHFGKDGEGFIRIAYATSQNRLAEGLERLKIFVRGLN